MLTSKMIILGEEVSKMEVWSVRRLRRRARSSKMPKGKKPIPEVAGGSAGDSVKTGGREKDDGESLLESVLRASTLSGEIDQNIIVIIFFVHQKSLMPTL